MMADMLRTIRKLAPDLYAAASVHLVETSPALRAVQEKTLGEHAGKVAWHDGFDEVPPGFLLLAANEFFDAVPIRQFVKTKAGFRERLVGLGRDGDLTFLAGAGGLDPALLPPGHAAQPPGSIVEVAPARAAIMQMICDRLFQGGGTAVVIDYGHLEAGFGDTLQAVLKHRFDPPLAHPGEADLTTHVDFAALGGTARQAGLQCLYTTQGEFLLSLGLLERAGSLGAKASQKARERLTGEVERLASDDQMGRLFKVLAIARPGIAIPGFAPSN